MPLGVMSETIGFSKLSRKYLTRDRFNLNLFILMKLERNTVQCQLNTIGSFRENNAQAHRNAISTSKFNFFQKWAENIGLEGTYFWLAWEYHLSGESASQSDWRISRSICSNAPNHDVQRVFCRNLRTGRPFSMIQKVWCLALLWHVGGITFWAKTAR